MNKIEKEILQKFAVMLLRWAIVVVGSWLIKKGVIDQPTLDAMTGTDILLAMLGAIAVGLTTIWGYWRVKYNIALPKAALDALPGTPMSVVKTEVKSRL